MFIFCFVLLVEIIKFFICIDKRYNMLKIVGKILFGIIFRYRNRYIINKLKVNFFKR